jgi:tetratricopeptide (TPR) repeat protein
MSAHQHLSGKRLSESPTVPAVREFVMRFYPAALALSLLVGVSASVGQAKSGEALDPRAQMLLASGRDALTHGDAAGATDAFEAALALDPGAVQTLLALGDAARHGGMQGKAIHFYRLALAREPDNLGALAGEGGAMAEKGALEKARRNLARLEGLCGRSCAEASALSGAIARGALPRVVSAEAIKPEPKVSSN